ncbi:MAG: sigma-54 dependent transcriptional regulator [Thermodesulfobacteriota bacterium]|nr:sigma-54 dependent transcriptional regulator [Thermodesulfobacteriota bacterium]
MKTHRILVVDDEKLVCWSLNEMLNDAGYTVETALSGAEALSRFDTFNPHMVLLDIRLPDANGIELLAEFKSRNEDVLVLMITAYADADSAVKALKIGADDYIGKPFNLDDIKDLVEQCFIKSQITQNANSFSRKQRKKHEFDTLIGNSPGIINVFKMINVCAKTDAKIVTIHGESGTGKQLVAHAIHVHSSRSDAPFIEINCAAIPENLLENELFGHEKGAFTDAVRTYKGIFEAAEGGTVFLDEIGDMPLIMQTKILKLLDSRQFRRLGGTRDIEANVRIITATHQDLEQLVTEDKFRKDLFFRLNVMPISIPPLKDRKEDISTLANYFIQRLNEEYGSTTQGITPEAIEHLQSYSWPGNVRELRNSIERAMMLEQSPMLSSRYFDLAINSQTQQHGTESDDTITNSPQTPQNNVFFTLPPEGISIAEVEKELITQALDRFDGNQTQAAKCLCMSRDTLRYRLKKHGISKRIPL